MESVKFRLKYDGQSADEHLLPAHEGAQSIEGMAWAFSLIGNYAATGRIRKRGTMDPRVRFFITPAQRGSYTTDIVAFLTEPNNIFLTSVLGTYAIATIGSAFNSLIKYSYKRVCGLFDDEDSKEYRHLAKLPSGDLEAILDGIEPSVSRAHSVISAGAQTLTLQRGRTPIVQLNAKTKAYVQTNIMAKGLVEKEVSIGALNVNSGNGRAYLDELSKTVPFTVIKEPLIGTYTTLSASLDRYARGLPNTIIITCQEVLGVDGRIKKLIVHSARTFGKDSF